MLFSVWIRGLSAATIDVAHYITYYSSDGWYNFRQIELMIHNFPNYAWFDPMTAYPMGKSIDWGPLLPFIVSSICILFGMTSRPDMMTAASWVIPLFAALMVPLLYVFGKRIGDWKTGIVAAGLITVLSGLYFVYSSFGNVDHHVLETFFSTLFCFLYLLSLFYWKEHVSELKKYSVLITGFGLSLVTGIVYFMGYLNMPTMVLFGLIVAIFTFFQGIINNRAKRTSELLLITNLGIFLPVILLMLIFGVKQSWVSFQQYSLAQVFAIFAIIAETVFLFILSKKLQHNSRFFLLSVSGVIVAIFVASRLLLGDVVLSTLVTVFGQQPEISTIIESKPWSLALAFNSFNFALILTLMGFIILLYQLYRKKQHEYLFLVTWSLIVFFATVQHFRYEYYFVVNVALLSSIAIVMGITAGLVLLGPDIRIFGASIIPHRTTKTPDKQAVPTPVKKAKGKRESENSSQNRSKKSANKVVLGVFVLVGIILLTLLTVGLSVQNDIAYSTTPDRLINTNWVETMEWLPVHTPDPGVNYLGNYQKENFVYPGSAYGILSWWDYGHYITFIGKRIPVTNPFQDNLAGPSGAAAFFMAGSENESALIAESMGARYVITDTSTTTDTFETLATWYNNNTGISSYVKSFFIQNPQKSGQLLQLNGEFYPYFQTTVVRLHNFDGSMQIPGTVTYLVYNNENRNGFLYPMVTNAQTLNVADATNAIKKFEQQPEGNSQAVIVGQYLQPLGRVPALQHFRLAYESTGNSRGIMIHDTSGAENLKLVKVFEVVKGAHIKGEGAIELQVVTNTGRTFTYRQESNNGEFIVPYSTVNNTYEVKANGKYHILGTTIGIDVTENDVIEGKNVN
ncbi:MAG: oligosaccharyl transferase, archaeosortase A system-associated, partial [Methanomicrobiales archaeon]|nr:oligosaccharyl transferase, archaeosortase A system-associated [Methanomicrobiales archaeon]